MSDIQAEIVHCYHCDGRHVDQGPYAEEDHSMHLCEHCKRFFYTAKNVGVAHKPLALNSDDHPGGIAIWPATAPLYDSRKPRNRGSSHGYHVHAYGEGGVKTVDGTWDEVSIDDERVAPRSLPPAAPTQEMHGTDPRGP